MNMGARLRESSPWAIVLPPGSSCFARSSSTWIHCSSQVASANLVMRSCVISIQSLAPTSVPIAALISSKPLNIRMVICSGSRVASDLHFRNLVRYRQLGLRHRKHFRDADAGRGFDQRDLAADKADDRHVGDDKIDWPLRGERQAAFAHDL